RLPCEVVDFTAGQDCDEGQYFSGGFNVKPKTIEKYGAFNISLVSDLPLFIPSKRGMGVWKKLRVSHIPTPSARRRLRTNFKRGATLTIYLVQNPGQLSIDCQSSWLVG